MIANPDRYRIRIRSHFPARRVSTRPHIGSGTALENSAVSHFSREVHHSGAPESDSRSPEPHPVPKLDDRCPSRAGPVILRDDACIAVVSEIVTLFHPRGYGEPDHRQVGQAWVPDGNRAAPRRRAIRQTVAAVVPTGRTPQEILNSARRRQRDECASRIEPSDGHPAPWSLFDPRNSAATSASARDEAGTVRELDDPPLRRIAVPSRRSCRRKRVARVPRRHRHHQRMVVVDALAVPVRGGGLAVDGEPEGLVSEDDGVGR